MSASMSTRSREIRASEETRRTSVDPRIPIYLVTGIDPAVRTALLRRIADQASGVLRAALVLSERASWECVHGAGETHGCVRSPTGPICRFAGDDLVDTFYQLHLHRLGLFSPSLDYDRVIVEARADSDAGSLAAVVHNDVRLDASYRLARIICAVDPSGRDPRHCASHLRQIAQADTVVLAGSGRRNADALASAENIVASVNPFSTIVEIEDYDAAACRPWRIPVGDFMPSDTARLSHETGMVKLERPEAPVCALVANLYNDTWSNAPGDIRPHRALRLWIPGEVDLMRCMQVFDELIRAPGTDVVRLSGVLNARHADYPIAVNAVGGTLLHPSYHERFGRQNSDIAIIAQGLDAAATARAFGRCAWHVAATHRRFAAAV